MESKKISFEGRLVTPEARTNLVVVVVVVVVGTDIQISAINTTARSTRIFIVVVLVARELCSRKNDENSIQRGGGFFFTPSLAPRTNTCKLIHGLHQLTIFSKYFRSSKIALCFNAMIRNTSEWHSMERSIGFAYPPPIVVTNLLLYSTHNARTKLFRRLNPSRVMLNLPNESAFNASTPA